MTAKSINSSCSVLSGGVAWRFISPCVRNTGGSPTRRCRSEEADCTSFLSSSPRARSAPRSEEHTSELQSLAYLVCRLLLEKKKQDLDCIRQCENDSQR